MAEPAVGFNKVSKRYCRNLRRSLWYGLADIARELTVRDTPDVALRKGEFWALRDVIFTLNRGDSLGLIGRNGAGKSTLLKLLSGLVKPDGGHITVRGQVGALIELGAGFNPILTGRENIFINAAVLGLSRAKVNRLIDEIIEFAELEEFIDAPVQSYSSGMRVRLGFSIATHLQPDILLVDEVLAVGDTGFRRKCIDHLKTFLEDRTTSLILVSHNLRHIEQTCRRALHLDGGRIAMIGETDEVIANYLEQINAEHSQRAEGAGRSREGTGEVRFTRVKLPAGDRQQPGDPLDIEAHFDCHEARDFVRFRIGLVDTATQTLITIANHDVHDLSTGGVLRCRFPDINLLPRSYEVYLSATDLLLLFDRWSPAARFVVVGARDDSMKYSVGDGELLRLANVTECDLAPAKIDQAGRGER